MGKEMYIVNQGVLQVVGGDMNEKVGNIERRSEGRSGPHTHWTNTAVNIVGRCEVP